MSFERSHRGDIDRARDRKAAFDPIAEGRRYRLSPEVLEAIWRRVCGEATDDHGLSDERRAQQRFHDVAARVAARGGSLRPGPGKTTLVEAEAQGIDRAGDVFADLAPGRLTQVSHRDEVHDLLRGLETDGVGRRGDGRSAASADDRSARRKPVDPPIAPAVGPPGTTAPSMRRALAALGGGAPLDERTRALLEDALDADLSTVRVHTDRDAGAAAAAIDARAFTVGRDIYLGDGQRGDELLAHEVAHTLQPIGGTAALGDPASPAEREAARFADGLFLGAFARVAEPRTAVIQRDTAGAGRIAQLRALLEDDDEDGAISLMGQLTSAEVAQVLASTSLRELAVSAFDDEEMYRGVRAMNGNLVKSLEWLFAEDTEVGYAIDIIRRCSSDAQRAAVYASGPLRASFVSLCGDDEMRQVTEALGGTLKQKLGWMFAEGTSWEVVRALVAAAPEAHKAEVRTDPAMRANFVSLLGDDEMRDLVLLLGGALIDQLGWMFAEGTDWPSLRLVIERQADATQRAAVRASTAMRDKFVEVIGNDQMEELVVLLGGDLHWKLGWMFEEGTDYEAVLRRIKASPDAECAAVRADAAMRGQFVSLLGDDEMAEVVKALKGDLLFQVDWLIAEGTSWDKVKDLIRNAPEAQKAATRASTTARDRFVDLLGDDEMKEAVQLLGGDLHFKLDWMFAEGTDWASVKALIQAAPEAEKAVVRGSAAMKAAFIDLLGDDEMKEAVQLLGGDLRFKLDWMLSEGSSWSVVKPMIQAASEADKAGVRGDPRMKGQFIDLLGDDEMKEAVVLLGGDLHFKLDWMLAEGTEWASVKALIQAAPEAEKATVRGSAAMKAAFIDLLGDDEMKEAVVLLGGDLHFKLDWMFAEGTEWASVKALIQAAPEAEKATVRGSAAMKAAFIDLLGDDEMKEAVALLGGDLHFKLDWMFAEGTEWASVKALIQAAPEAEKATVRGSAAMKAAFIDLLGDDEMKEAVALLGGDLHFKLDWMLAEGTEWASVKALIQAAPEAEKATVRGSAAMKAAFIDLLGDDEMKEAVSLLGGDLHFKLDWMLAEGTEWASVKALIQAAPEAEKATVRGSAAMKAAFIDLLGDDEMKEAVVLLGGDLHFKLDWMLAEGTEWASVKALIQAAPEAEKATVRGSAAMKAAFIDLLGDDEMKEAVVLLGGDLHFKLDWMFAEGTEWASVKALIQAAPEVEKATVRGSAAMKAAFIDLLGDDEMKEAVALLGGDLHFKLDWMFAEGTEWASVKALIQAAPEAEKATVRGSAAMKAAFIDLLGDDEMKEAVSLLGGDLHFKLDWMFAEGTEWASVKALIQAAPEAEKAVVRDDAAMKGRFIELLGDDEMKEAVELLGGDLYFKLSWTLAEGTSWASIKALLLAADEAGKARVRGDLGMRGWFVDNLGNAEMAEAVSILGGDLAFKLSWTLAEGTSWEAVKALIQAAPAAQRPAVLADREIFDQLVGLVGNDQMRDLLDLLGADLLTRVRWMITEGTDDAALRAAITAATPEQQIALIQDTLLGDVLGVLSGSAIEAFPALADAGRFATAMSVPLMVAELLEKPAQDVLTRLSANPAAAAAALDHMDDGLSWMSPLPTRGALSGDQRQQLRVLFDHAPRVPQRWALFARRFGADLSGRWGSTLDPGDLGHLWVLLERLPDAQIEDNSKIDDLVRHFKGGGSYGGSEIEVGSNTGGSHPFYEDMAWKSAAEMAAFLGIPEADLAARVASQQLEQQVVGGVTQYRIKEIGLPYFDHTVLHEVGHAVDDMLGGETDIVYGWAGWEKFREGRVREWADLMGGWGAVQPGDDLEDVKNAICSVMDDYMDKSSAIEAPSAKIGDDLPADHPFKKYAAWPIVRRAGTKMFHYTGSNPYNDGTYLYTANFYYQKWMRVKSQALQNIPRDYTRFAPEEWFADMYAEYYRQYDGTPATDHLKGGNCPGVVKTWFDNHVDNLGHTPQATAPGGSSPAPHSGVSGGQR